MPDDDFFQRQILQFSEHRALAMAMAARDEQAERHISTAEYELVQAHRALSAVLQSMQAPAQLEPPLEAAPLETPEILAADSAAAA